MKKRTDPTKLREGHLQRYERFDAFRGRVQVVRIAAGDDDVGTEAREGERNRFSDTAPAAGNQRGLALEQAGCEDSEWIQLPQRSHALTPHTLSRSPRRRPVRMPGTDLLEGTCSLKDEIVAMAWPHNLHADGQAGT